MKLIHVVPVDDYCAVGFEEEHGTEPSLELWNRVKNREEIFDDDGNPLEVTAEEFGDIDPKFIKFLYSSGVIDYDSAKHNNFYVVKEA